MANIPVKGVSFDKGTNKYRSRIYVNGKHKHLGLFDTYEDAVKARKAAEIKYGFHENHGKLNKLKEEL